MSDCCMLAPTTVTLTPDVAAPFTALVALTTKVDAIVRCPAMADVPMSCPTVITASPRIEPRDDDALLVIKLDEIHAVDMELLP